MLAYDALQQLSQILNLGSVPTIGFRGGRHDQDQTIALFSQGNSLGKPENRRNIQNYKLKIRFDVT